MINEKLFLMCRTPVFLALLSISFSACAIDNPDVTDYVAKFEQSSQAYLQQINKAGNNNRQTVVAYSRYQKFLETEVKSAYKILKAKLNKSENSSLEISQRNWIQFRDSEFKFIDANWTRKNFGSSYVVSRGDYKCKLIKNRIMELLNYAKNY